MSPPPSLRYAIFDRSYYYARELKAVEHFGMRDRDANGLSPNQTHRTGKLKLGKP